MNWVLTIRRLARSGAILLLAICVLALSTQAKLSQYLDDRAFSNLKATKLTDSRAEKLDAAQPAEVVRLQPDAEVSSQAPLEQRSLAVKFFFVAGPNAPRPPPIKL